MDVDVRVALKGGHSVDFTCDEDDPMIFGLVSALPGVGIDATLHSQIGSFGSARIGIRGQTAMRQPPGRKDRAASPIRSAETGLLELGREFDRLRRRCRRLQRGVSSDWASWSAAVTEVDGIVRKIDPMQPHNLHDLAIRYEALQWLMLERDDAIMDAEARLSFIAFGRALRRMARQSATG